MVRATVLSEQDMAAIVEARRRGVRLRALAKQFHIGFERLKDLAPPEVAPVEERRGVRPIDAEELAQMFAERAAGGSWLSIAERHYIGLRRVRALVTPDPKLRRQPEPEPEHEPEPEPEPAPVPENAISEIEPY